MTKATITFEHGATWDVDIDLREPPPRHNPEGLQGQRAADIPWKTRARLDFKALDAELHSSGVPLAKGTQQAVEAPYNTSGGLLGAKRLPRVGEVWRNRSGALVAVMSQASVLDGGYNVVTLSAGSTAKNPGHVYVVNLDGNMFRDNSGAQGDLVAFTVRFDIKST